MALNTNILYTKYSMYAFVVGTRYTASGLDYTAFLTTVGTPSLIDGSAATVTATTFNGVAGFYVPVVAGSCVKFDPALGLAGSALGLAGSALGPVDDLDIRVSELAL